MTEDEMKAQIQVAQDMIKGLENQRNAHANECVQLAAQSMALQRKVTELEAKVTQLEGAEADKEAEADPRIPARANGHAEATAAVN